MQHNDNTYIIGADTHPETLQNFQQNSTAEDSVILYLYANSNIDAIKVISNFHLNEIIIKEMLNTDRLDAIPTPLLIYVTISSPPINNSDYIVMNDYLAKKESPINEKENTSPNPTPFVSDKPAKRRLEIFSSPPSPPLSTSMCFKKSRITEEDQKQNYAAFFPTVPTISITTASPTPSQEDLTSAANTDHIAMPN